MAFAYKDYDESTVKDIREREKHNDEEYVIEGRNGYRLVLITVMGL